MFLFLSPLFPNDVPPEAPVEVAYTSGLDYISRSRFQSLGKSRSIHVSWRAAKLRGFLVFEILVPASQADAFFDAYRKDEDLDANSHSVYWLTLKDRFFSLPKGGVVLEIPRDRSRLKGEFAGKPISKFLSYAESSIGAKAALRNGYRPKRLSLAVRDVQVGRVASHAIDLCLLSAKGGKSLVTRTQLFDGYVADCGQIREFPVVYELGLRNSGSTKGAISG